MRIFGLIGYPLTHSFSKKYFSDKFEKEAIKDARYELFPLTAITDLPALISSQPQLVGLNVTIPYKEKLGPYLHSLSDVVNETGACNCILIREGQLKGYNTDVLGFEQSLLRQWKSTQNKALVLGTGGAAKAVEYVLRKLGIGYHVVSRLKSPGRLVYEEITPSILGDHLLVINTTPVGMYPHTDQAPDIPYEAVTQDHYLFDLIYNPATTRFLEKGKEKGATVQNGYDMLCIQAEESWKIWNSPNS